RTSREAGAPSTGELIALAYPDRIAKARGAPGSYLMANGREARIEPHDALAKSAYLAIGEIAGRAAGARIVAAAALDRDALERVAGDEIESVETVAWDARALAVRGRRLVRLGALTLSEATLPATGEAVAAELARGALADAFDRLPWAGAPASLSDRLRFLRAREGGEWPDVSDDALRADSAWLADFLAGKSALAEVTTDDLAAALRARVPPVLARRLESEAPTHYVAPTGNRFAIDYAGPNAPAVSLRVQEVFGETTHPAAAGGRAPLTLELLSPAHRPIQVTRDLPGFWKGAWREVRTEMRGRYPRHVWPEDPAAAAPTARAKPRGT
ncbi:MAG: ATP-dependent helicase HrpB, partial [Hyphomicrobiales bacterium]|nr:ATP-dependent helicase HrpB [Hyphomicrobiales bacterium]